MLSPLKRCPIIKALFALQRRHAHSAELNYNYLCSSDNFQEIQNNIAIRKGIGNISLIHDLATKLKALPPEDASYSAIQTQLQEECFHIPNRTHAAVVSYGEEAKLVKKIGSEKMFDTPPLDFDDISKKLNLVRTSQLGTVAGHRSYYLLGELADLEQALIKYTLRFLYRKGFKLVSVPDILPRSTIEDCGMNTRGERSQVYELLAPKIKDTCLSGTSEMALAGLFKNRILKKEELPMKVASVSRCYRAETSTVSEEKGLFRVHEFTKVEMFALCEPSESDQLLEEFRGIEEEHFSSLGLHLRTMDMPPHELGAPAYRKYDIEAWMPARSIFGEVSSCSNCTDYQSRRLGIKYSLKSEGELDFVHTLNGTACAIPRMLIALIETHQNPSKGFVEIPLPLREFMQGKSHIARQKRIPEVRLVKNKEKM